MEGKPDDPIGKKFEALLSETRTDDITLVRFAGVISTLEGWKRTYQEDELPEKQTYRESFLSQWSQEARDFFLELPRTKAACLFEVGAGSIVGHQLRELDDSYALYDKLILPAGSSYHINFADMKNVPSDSFREDLPDDRYSDLEQLYIGDTVKGVAISYNQFAGSLLNYGQMRLI